MVLRGARHGDRHRPDILPQIFDLFVQGGRGLDRSRGGVGIGLTLVKMLVDLHEGSIEAHSPGVGQGSKFVVRLPVVKAAGQRTKEAKNVTRALAAAPGPARKVLVVDDNAGRRRQPGHAAQNAWA